jgi:hypothetical protein
MVRMKDPIQSMMDQVWSDAHQNLTKINDDRLRHIDEAMTSLERFPRDMNDHDARELAADALQRLRLFVLYF